jgi:hypothetical protein
MHLAPTADKYVGANLRDTVNTWLIQVSDSPNI